MKTADRWLLPDGVEELLPEQAQQAELLRRKLLDLYSSWGYELIIPPLLEFTESLLVGLGSDIDLQTFRVTDQLTGRLMGIRADITPQAARIDAHSLRREGVVRLCYAGSVLHTRPQFPLASRSPIQLGAELYGDNSAASDLEIISLMLATLRAVKLQDVTLDLGHVGVYRSVIAGADLGADEEQHLFDLLQRKAVAELAEFIDDCVDDSRIADMLTALVSLHGGEEVLQRGRQLFASVPEACAAIDCLEALAGKLKRRDPSVSLYFDLAELRGYHYHTGLVFSALVPQRGRALAWGGRYDDIGEVFGRARPATGFNVDLKALLALAPPAERVGAVLAPADEDTGLWQTVQRLRGEGERVIYAMPGQTDTAGCDRQLVREGDQWVVKPL